LKEVARIPRSRLDEDELVRLPYPPYDIVVALVDGVPFALEDSCNHAGASLAEGFLKGDRLVCPMHGYVFSLRSGELLAPKGLCDAQRRYKATVEGDDVVIWDEFKLTIV